MGYRIANFKIESTSCVGRVVRISIKYKQQCEDWEQRVFRPCRNPLLGCGKIHSESERERCWDTHLTWTRTSYTLHSAVSFWRYSLDLDSLTQLHRTHCCCYTLWSLFGTIHTLLHNLRFNLWCLMFSFTHRYPNNFPWLNVIINWPLGGLGCSTFKAFWHSLYLLYSFCPITLIIIW